MNILILNASPKSKGSASAFYSSLLRLFLTGCEVKVNPLRGARDYEKIFGLLPWADAVVISAPVYVDAAPSHVTAFLEQAEQLCHEKSCHFRLYAISNCGFIEGHQNELHDVHSIAFPAISTGVYGYPLEDATEIAVKTVAQWLEDHADYAMQVIFCCFDARTERVYQAKL